MTVIWKKGSPAEFAALGAKITAQLYAALAAEMFDVAQQAAVTARALTAQRGSRTSRGSGRIDLGDMVAAIDGEVKLRAMSVIARFGFTGQQADYFLYQTVTGFEHWLMDGAFIEPTFALRDAKLKAEGDVYRAIIQAIASVKL